MCPSETMSSHRLLFFYHTPTSLLMKMWGGAGVFGFFMSVENPILFTQQEDQAYCEVEDTYI